MTGLEEHGNVLNELLNAIKHPVSTVHKVVNTSLSVIIILGGGFLGYTLHSNNKITERNATQVELLNKYYLIQTQQTTLLKIIDENLRDSDKAKLGSAPMEEKVAVAKVWYDLCATKEVPLSLLAGLADVESKWNTHAVSSMGCLGLLQVNPLYTRPYLRENRIDYRKDIYFDPVINSICGIAMLNDFQSIKIEAGLATSDNWNFATHDYLWGPAKRGNVLDMNYSIKVIEAMKRYQNLGLL